MNNAKKRKTIEWERVEISSRKLERSGIFPERIGMIKDRNDKTKQKMKRLRIGRNYTKKVLMTWVTTMVWSLTFSQTSWSVKSSGP